MAGTGLVMLALLLVPLRALQLGWLPPDDARRHAAHAIDDRTWEQVVVLREDAAVDQHAAWHALLRWVHRVTDWDAQTLLVLTLIGLAGSFLLVPVALLRRPEAWAAGVGLVAAADFPFASRVLSGRPLVLSMAAVVVILCIWAERRPRLDPWRLLATALTIGLAATLHGSWYLFALVVLAFAVAGRLRDATALLACWLAGTLAGALVSGHPLMALWAPLHHAKLALLSPAPWRVSEFAPSGGVPLAAVLVAALLAGRRAMKLEAPRPWRDPALVLALLGWLIGLRVGRAWLDWGAPALATWAAMELERMFEARARGALARVGLAAAAGALLLLTAGTDRGRRFSFTANEPRLRDGDATLDGWLPDPGGILYNQAMADFYSTYLEHPHGPWRYELGFEPALMPDEDLAIYRRMQAGGYSLDTFLPWVARMRPADRLLLRWDGPDPPPLPRLEWKHAEADRWIGRVPR